MNRLPDPDRTPAVTDIASVRHKLRWCVEQDGPWVSLTPADARALLAALAAGQSTDPVAWPVRDDTDAL
jgi:hypothetical protein